MTGSPCGGTKALYVDTTDVSDPLCTTEETRFWRFDENAGAVDLRYDASALPVESGAWNVWHLWHCDGTGATGIEAHGWSNIHADQIIV